MRNSFWLAVALAAACSPAGPDQAAAPAVPDSAATRGAIQAMLDDYSRKAEASDVAGLVSLYADNATLSEFGLPTLTGRAGIEAAYAAVFGIVKVRSATIQVESAMAPAPGLASGLGTYAETVDSSGVLTNSWGRWAGSYRQDSTGQWKIAFLMAFPDSVKAAK